MRTLAVTQHITLDGVVELGAGWFDPAAGSADVAAATREQAARSDAVLLGRRTFEDMRGFWPHQTDDETGVTDHLNRVAKHVVSTTLGDPEWARTTVHRSADGIVDLKAAEGDDIVVTGSIQLTRSLFAAGLVDELRLFVHPVLAGSGRRLFEGEQREYETADVRRFDDGTVLLVAHTR
jgi:dihydrofolate reductase